MLFRSIRPRSTGARSQAEWVEFFADLDVCFAPVNDLRTGLDLAQTKHREMCLTDEEGREHLGTPMKFSREPAVIRFQAPAHGEQTTDILSELGYDQDDLGRLKTERVV